MRVAATFLLSVTIFTSVFLQSSAQDIDSVQIPATRQYIITTFDNSNALLASTISCVEDAVDKVTGDDKDIVTDVLNWLNYLQGVSANAESTILDGLAAGTANAVQNVVTSYSKAIGDTAVQTDQYVQLLAANPGEVMDSVKTVVKVDMDVILVRATSCWQTINALISIGQANTA